MESTGADINVGLWLVNPKTLQLSWVGDTFMSGITDLAYDSFTRRLIVVSVGVKCISFNCAPQTGMIWSIDPFSPTPHLQTVLLNDNAPPIYDLAELTPEPGRLSYSQPALSAFLPPYEDERSARLGTYYFHDAGTGATSATAHPHPRRDSSAEFSSPPRARSSHATRCSCARGWPTSAGSDSDTRS